jgi:hypothetical protein
VVDNLLRQRRNLVALSSLLVVFNFSDITIAKVSILGTELLVGDPTRLAIFVWVAWAYFLVRYYQYWREIPDKSLVKSFSGRFNNYAEAYADKKYIRGQNSSVNYKLSNESVYSWSFDQVNVDPVTGDSPNGERISIPFIQVVLWVIKSLVFVCIKTPHMTEHVLPFIIAVFAVISTIFTTAML